MTAIVSGNSLGLLNTSSSVLEHGGVIGNPTAGRKKESSFVNIATGNLALQNVDDFIAADGLDVAMTRTYNLQGRVDEGNGQQWKVGLRKQVSGPSGTVNEAGSTVTRTEGDGSVSVYAFDVALGAYVSTDGGGAYRTIVRNQTEWIWRDGRGPAGGRYEVYDATTIGRIVRAGDSNGDSLIYSYDTNGMVSQIVDATGDITHFDYDQAGNISQYRTVGPDGFSVQIRVRYSYDGQNRLSKVITDLSPEDGGTADGKVYTTSYTYSGTSNRILNSTQSDGTSLSFTYLELAGIWKVQTVTEGLNSPTKFDYSVPSKTTVTDPNGLATTYSYNDSGQLTNITGPEIDGHRTIHAYEYDVQGNVSRNVDQNGVDSRYRYDARGNRTSECDAAGNTKILREFSKDGNLLTRETLFVDEHPQVTNYVYDDSGYLRFTVGPTGVVKEYRYNTSGQRSEALEYTGPGFPHATRYFDFHDDAGTLGMPVGAVVHDGSLRLTSTNQPGFAASVVTDNVRPAGTSWRFEVTMPATITNDLFSASLDAGQWFSDDCRRLRLTFSNNVIGAQLGTGTAIRFEALGSALPGATYIIELGTSPEGRASAYVYAKGTDREHGYFISQQFGEVPGIQFSLSTESGPGAVSGNPGASAFVSIDRLLVQEHLDEGVLTDWLSADGGNTGVAHREQYTYDARGLIASLTSAAPTDTSSTAGTGSTVKYVHDQAGLLLQYIDSSSVATTFTYDGLGRELATVGADGEGSLNVYDDAGNCSVVKLHAGDATTSVYDASGYRLFGTSTMVPASGSVEAADAGGGETISVNADIMSANSLNGMLPPQEELSPVPQFVTLPVIPNAIDFTFAMSEFDGKFGEDVVSFDALEVTLRPNRIMDIWANADGTFTQLSFGLDGWPEAPRYDDKLFVARIQSGSRKIDGIFLRGDMSSLETQLSFNSYSIDSFVNDMVIPDATDDWESLAEASYGQILESPEGFLYRVVIPGKLDIEPPPHPDYEDGEGVVFFQNGTATLEFVGAAQFSGAWKMARLGGLRWYFTNIAAGELAADRPQMVKRYLEMAIKNLVRDWAPGRAQEAGMRVGGASTGGMIWECIEGGMTSGQPAFQTGAPIGTVVTEAWGVTWRAVGEMHGNASWFLSDTNSEMDMVRPADSHDSYAATLVWAVQKYVEVTGDVAWLNKSSVHQGYSNAGVLQEVLYYNILTQFVPGGLTRVFQNDQTPTGGTYAARFLMDNVEVWAGLNAAVDIFRRLGDNGFADYVNLFASSSLNGLEGMWQEEAGAYRWEAGVDMTATPEKALFYPYVNSQLWASYWRVPLNHSRMQRAADFAAEHFVDWQIRMDADDFAALGAHYGRYLLGKTDDIGDVLENARRRHLRTHGEGEVLPMEFIASDAALYLKMQSLQIRKGNLGLENNEIATLNQIGAGSNLLGQAGVLVNLNTQNGNLVLQDQDDVLVSAGLDVDLIRTYNSQAGGNGGWQFNAEKTIVLEPGGTRITRSNGDGSTSVYTRSNGVYRSSDGQGAYNTIVFDSDKGVWEWTRGDGGRVEAYDTAHGRIVSASDHHFSEGDSVFGNLLSYSYNHEGKLERITDASGDSMVFHYDAAGNTTSIETVLLTESGRTGKRVHYGYDNLNRLVKVTTDLDSLTVRGNTQLFGDSDIGNNNIYWTTYTYHGSSGRIDTIEQKDGSRLTLTYEHEESTDQWWVATATDAKDRITTFRQASGGNVIRDSSGHEVAYSYNQQGNLASVRDLTTNQKTSYFYDIKGNVETVTNSRGVTTRFAYDSRGNQTSEMIDGVLTIERSFGTLPGQVLTETSYVVAKSGGRAGSGAQTSRYAYNEQGLLRFSISAEGMVTEFRYNAKRELAEKLSYADERFSVAGLAANTALETSTLESWTAGVDKSAVLLTTFTYDLRGELSTSTTYEHVSVTGTPTGVASVQEFVYDHAGKLRQSLDARGGMISYGYDALGRLLSTVGTSNDATMSYLNSTTTIDDVARTTVTTSRGIATTSVFDKIGRLLTTTQSTRQETAVTRFTYDAHGRLRMTVSPTGQRNVILYDASGRKMADIDGDGTFVEYFYNAANQVSRTMQYATRVPASVLFSADGSPKESISQLRPGSSPLNDRSTWFTYDQAGRLLDTVDANGSVVRNVYDATSRVIAVIQRANTVSLGQFAALDTPDSVIQTASSEDRITRILYDRDGKKIGQLDAEGYLTETRYNAAGLPVEGIVYSQKVGVDIQANGDMTALRAHALPVASRTHFLYNAKGQHVGTVDGNGFLTETRYDKNGNVEATIGYGQKIAFIDGAALDSLRPAVGHRDDRSIFYTYTALNQVLTETRSGGATTHYAYNKLGNLVSTTISPGTPSETVSKSRFDAMGRLTAELGADQVAMLTGNESEAQLDLFWASHASTHKYDRAGNRISTTDMFGNRSLYFYDQDGRLSYFVNALGEVEERIYNAFNQLERKVIHGARIGAASLATLVGGQDIAAIQTIVAQLAWENSSVESYVYDRRGLLVDQTDAANYHTTTTYDQFGAVSGVRKHHNAGAPVANEVRDEKSTAIYNKDGRTIAVVSGDGMLTRTAYDASGRITAEVTFAKTFNAEPTADAIAAWATLNADAAHDREQRFIYDAGGNLTASLTAMEADGGQRTWSLVRSEYDSSGMVTCSVAFANALTHPDPLSEADLATIVVSPSDAKRRYVYDEAGRLIVLASAKSSGSGTTSWTFVRNEYDNRGNLKLQRSLKNEAAYAEPSIEDMLTASATFHWSDGLVYHVYDDANRVLATARAQNSGVGEVRWSVVKNGYDKGGRLESQTSFANLLVTSSATNFESGAWIDAVMANSANDRTTVYKYDELHRVVETSTPGGAVTKLRYNVKGQIALREVFASASNVDAHLTTRTLYDLLGRPVFSIDALGGVSESRYDAFGNVSSTVRYAAPFETALSADATLDDVRAGLDATDPANRTERFVYNKAGQLRYHVDAGGYITETRYDALGRISATVQLENPEFHLGSDMELACQNAVTGQHQSNRSSAFEYDAFGNLVSSTDPLQGVERFRYDALGNRIAFIDKLLRQWDYQYNAAGQLVVEESPQIDVVDNAGVASSLRLQTHIEYDAFGNVVARTEAANVPGYERKTEYKYDVAGNQVQTILAPVKVYDAAADNFTAGSVARVETGPLSASSVVEYDSFGNAVKNTDAYGNVTRKVYTVKGDLAYDIDALGYVTAYQRDTFGNATRMIRYAVELPVEVRNGDIPALGLAGLQAILDLADHRFDRMIDMKYDVQNRLIQSVEPSVELYQQVNQSDGVGNDQFSGRKLTTSRYNRFGEIIEQRTAAAIEENGQFVTVSPAAVTRFEYNLRGENVTIAVLADTQATRAANRAGNAFDTGAGIGAYVTRMQYDAAGNNTWVYEYANAVGDGEWLSRDDWAVDAVAGDGWKKNIHDLVDAPAFALNSAGNRVTEKRYDDNNRLTEEILIQGRVDNIGAGAPVQGRKDIRTWYSYDATGNLTETRNDLNGVTRSYYDSLGRIFAVTSIQGSSADDMVALADHDSGAAQAPAALGEALPANLQLELIGFRRDVFGNVVQRITYAGGTEAGAVPVLAAATPLDRVSTAKYDLVGNEIESTDAEGKTSYSSYDLLGRVAKQWRSVKQLSVANATGETFNTVYTVNRYDALGRITEMLSPGARSPLALTAFASASPLLVGTNTYQWLGQNSIAVSYPQLREVEVRVELGYYQVNSGVLKTREIMGQNIGAGAEFSWIDDVGPDGGVASIAFVKVSYKEENGSWQLAHSASGAELAWTNEIETGGATRKHDVSMYNGFGEVVGRQLNDIEYERNEYDNNGNVWRSNAGDGIVKVYYHDINGQVTMQLRSAGTAPGETLSEFESIMAVDASDGRFERTETRYDLLSRAVMHTSPGSEASIAEPAKSSEIVNAGIVMLHPSGKSTNYEITDPDRPSAEYVGVNEATVDFVMSDGLSGGEVMLKIDYIYTSNEHGIPDNNGGTIAEPPGGPQTYTGIFREDQLTLGLDGKWSALCRWEWQPPFDPALVSGISVLRKDVNGVWKAIASVTNPPPATELRPLQKSGGPFLKVAAAVIVEFTNGTESGTLPAVDLGDVTLLDLSALNGASYGLTMLRRMVDGSLCAYETATLHISAQQSSNNVATLSNSVLAAAIQPPKRVTYQSNDRWGNVTEMTDARGPETVTRYTYNTRSQLTDTSVVKRTLNAQGVINETELATTSNFYDAIGRQTGTRDANSNVNRQFYDSYGRLGWEVHADDGLVIHVYNRFGDRIQLRQQRNETSFVDTYYAHDKLGRVTSSWMEGVTAYTILNQSEDDGMLAGAEHTVTLRQNYTYDELGRRITSSRVSPSGTLEQVTRTRFDMNGNVVGTRSEAGVVVRFAYDNFQRKVLEQDGNGRTMTWWYREDGLLEGHKDMGNATIHYDYDGLRHLVSQTSTARGTVGQSQNIEYTYDDAGALITVKDHTLNQVTHYAYDLAGNRTREKTVLIKPIQAAGSTETLNREIVLQNNFVSFDVQNRMRKLVDGRYKVDFEYDKHGNRTMVDSNIDGSVIRKSYNTYDSMNRQLIVNGDNAGTDEAPDYVIGHYGHELTYDYLGNRTTDTYRRFGLNPRTEAYVYDEHGRLKFTIQDNTILDMRRYDDFGRLAQSGAATLNFSGSTWEAYKQKLNILGIDSSYTTYSYDDAGRTLRQKTRSAEHNGRELQDVYFERSGNVRIGYDNAGQLRGYLTVVPAGEEETEQFHTTMNYRHFDAYVQWQVTQENRDGSRTSTSEYDQNGNLIRVSQPAYQALEATERIFFHDADGKVLRAVSGNVATFSSIVNGELLGTTGGVGADAVPGTYASTYRPMGTAVAENTPSVYIVKRPDETLQTIAKAVWGDSTLWYLIADANGLGRGELTAGTALQLPARTTAVHNTYQTFNPYDPSGIVGNATPDLPPPAAPDAKCGVVGMIVTIVVVAILNSYAPWGQTIWAKMGYAATGATAGQAAAVAVGEQKKIDWRAVSINAIGALVAPVVAENTFVPISDPVLATTVSTALTQAVGSKLGLIQSFQWRSVAASVAAQSLNRSASNIGFDSPWMRTAAAFTSGMAGGMAAAAIRGVPMNLRTIAADAFGNALGSSITDAMKSSAAQEVKAKTRAVVGKANPGGVELFDRMVDSGKWTPEQAAAYASRPSFTEIGASESRISELVGQGKTNAEIFATFNAPKQEGMLIHKENGETITSVFGETIGMKALGALGSLSEDIRSLSEKYHIADVMTAAQFAMGPLAATKELLKGIAGDAIVGEYASRATNAAATVVTALAHGSNYDTLDYTLNVDPMALAVGAAEQKEWQSLKESTGKVQAGSLILTGALGAALLGGVMYMHAPGGGSGVSGGGPLFNQTGAINPRGTDPNADAIPWSSGSVNRADRQLAGGANKVNVGSRSEAEELMLRRFFGAGYKNSTGIDGPGTKQLFGDKAGTYHWDTERAPDGRVLGHGPKNPDGDLPHLQIHPKDGGSNIHIFFPWED